MRLIALLAAAAALGCSPAARADDIQPRLPEVAYPALPQAARDAQGFVPKGWALEVTAEGDLDGDGTADLALLLRDKDPANVVTTLTSDGAPYDANPRLLAVALAETGGGFRLALENHSLVPRPDNPGQEDVMADGGIAVERGSLKVDLSLFMNAGGSDAGRSSFRFRLEDGRFRLIGYDNYGVNRMSGQTEEVSVNYLTAKAIIKTGSIENDKVKAEVRKLKRKEVLTIDDVGNGMMFEPEF